MAGDIVGERGSVFLLSDYGSSDEFAGVMRAVVQRVAPGAPMVDLTHEVPMFDVRAGSLALERALPYLGPGVVLAVVDPGVATERRAVAVEAGSASGPAYLVGPDNGLLARSAALLGGPRRVVALRRPAAERATGLRSSFDGRDVFAPAAASLWSGSSLGDLGQEVDPGSLVKLAPPFLEVAGDSLTAEVLWIDRFGNVQLAAREADMLAAGLSGPGAIASVSVLPASAGGIAPGTQWLQAVWSSSFAGIAPGALGLIVDANGHLSLACREASAAGILGLTEARVVVVRAPGPNAAGPTAAGPTAGGKSPGEPNRAVEEPGGGQWRAP
ncbi:MAG: SAM-dependent chlorinase/fluorinase [Actinobacteria bacterium]|nr:SAM-dependent chlorinase/fluorinase [Actinomycetota bacterium]